MTTPEQPLVSVVIPCLNRAHFLVPTIESVLKQDYPHIECIVVDGGSTDGTIEILKSYGDRIKWISEPDKNHADAINKGWKMSKGEILAWLNADDCYVVPDAIRNAVAYLQENPDVDVVYGDYKAIDVNGNVISDIVKPRRWDLTYAVRYCHYTIPQPASFIRRTILEKVNWLDPEFPHCKDHELWLRIGLVGKITYAPVLLAYGRVSPGLSQHVETSEYKVRLTKKFLSASNLPPPFNSRRFRRCAISNAYLVGSSYAWSGRHLKIFPAYLTKAIAVDPLNLPYILARALRLVITSTLSPLLPRALKSVLKRIMRLS